ncbi:MAG: PilZ domain-containing protein [Bdellovibrionaceae bacterium]|nr:PilZ domain-containing protein [Pseudobdellovibrionaceae bacterium]
MVQTGKIWIFYDSKNKKQSKPLNLTQAQALILNLAQKKNFQAYIWTPGWEEWVDLKSFLEVDQDYFVVPPSIKKKTLDKTSVTKTLTRFRESKTAITSVTENFEKTLLVPLDPDNLVVNEPKPTFTEVSKDTPNQKVDYGYFYPDFKAENIDLDITRLKGRLKSAPQGNSQTENVKLESSVSADRRENIRYNFAIEIILITKKGKTFKSQSENISISGVKLREAIPPEFLMTDFSVIISNKLEKDPKKARIHFNSKCVGDVSDPKRLVFLNPDQKSQRVLEDMISSYIQQVQKKEKAG